MLEEDIRLKQESRKLSKITDNLIGQPMFELLAKAREIEKSGKNIIHFEIGDPSFNSPPKAIEAIKKALDNNLTHYTNSMGMFEFREAIALFSKMFWGFQPSIDQVLICPANAVIDFVIRCVADSGDEIIYPDPGFPTYYSAIKYNGMVPVGVKLKEENGFRMDPDQIRGKITSKTRLIIINTPQNPTGSVMTEREILEIANISKENGVYLLSDEVYAEIIYGQKHYSPSLLDQCKEQTIILNSLSKTYSMSGWRLGYAIGPAPLIKKMGLLLQTIISCLPPFLQYAGKEVIFGDQQIVFDRVEQLKKRRDIVVRELNSFPGVSCLVPEGAFYVFPNITATGMNSDEFCNKMLEDAGVCILPGNCFGQFGEGYVRLCYASTELKAIKEALVRMKEVLSLAKAVENG